MPTDENRSLVTHCHGPSPGTVLDHLPSFALPALGEVEAWYAPISALRPRTEEFNATLDPVEMERAERFRFNVDRERFILGHGLLRILLGHYLQRDASLVRMARGPFGKPYLERKTLHFNLSDTKDAILIAFANEAEVGADIETMVRDVDHRAVSEHYFIPAEIRSIEKAATEGSSLDGKRRFLELWTRKEAVLKASGVGIMDDLKALRVDGAHNTMRIAHEAFVAMAASEYHVHTYHVGPDHLISIAGPNAVSRTWLFDATLA